LISSHFYSKSSESSSCKSAETNDLNLVQSEPSEDDGKKEVINFASQTTFGTNDMWISQSTINSDVQYKQEIKIADSFLSGKSVETISVASDDIAKLASPEDKKDMRLSEGENSSGEESIKLSEGSSVSSISQKSSSSDNNENAESIQGQRSGSADASIISAVSQKSSSAKSVQPIDTIVCC